MGSRRRLRDEAGFTILESTIALALVFVVLVALLGALTTGARGLITGRQRSAALALANEVVEDARGRAYGDVGHDLDSDPTLAADVENIEGVAPNYVYKETNEPLAASAVDAGDDAGTVDNALYPFSPHVFTSQREATVYTTSVYVTTVTPATGDGDPYKRITVKVKWSPAQYVSAARSVVISSFVFNAGSPPDPELLGSGEADGGSFQVTGFLALPGVSLADASITFPYVNGSIDSSFVKSAKGLARSATSDVNLLGGTLTGCPLLGLLAATCDPAKAEVDADNDSGTAPPDTDQEGPNPAALATVTAASLLSIGLGSGTAQAEATARSCWTCPPGAAVGDDDRLPYFEGTATGPASVSVDVVPGLLGGSLLSIGTGCALECAKVTVDRNDSGSNQGLTSTAAVKFPALALLTFAGGAPAGYSGMVKIGAGEVRATAHSGPGAFDPEVTGSPVTIELWDNGAYETITLTPGDSPPAADPTAHAEFTVGLTQVVVDATVHWNKLVTSQASSGGAVSDASASLTNWLFVDLHVVMTAPLLGTVADLNVHLDYGRIAATATYEPVA